MTLPTWVLVFMFFGHPMASGLHELEQCLIMLETLKEQQVQLGPTAQAHCWNPKTQERRTK